MMIMIWAAVALQQVPGDYRPLLTFSAHPELRHVTTRVDVGLLTTGAGRTKHYWFRKTVQPDQGEIVETLWADTRACPDSRGALDDLVKLEMPRPHVYGLDGNDDLILMADGVTYRLETAVADPNGRITLQTNTGTSLGRWVETAFVRLNECWKSTPPKRAS